MFRRKENLTYGPAHHLFKEMTVFLALTQLGVYYDTVYCLYSFRFVCKICKNRGGISQMIAPPEDM